MTRPVAAFAATLLFVASFASTLDGGYGIAHPMSSAQILSFCEIACDGACPEGEQVVVDLANHGNIVRSQQCNVGPMSETWSHTFAAPPLGWIEGTGWQCNLRDSDFSLEVIAIFEVIGFGV